MIRIMASSVGLAPGRGLRSRSCATALRAAPIVCRWRAKTLTPIPGGAKPTTATPSSFHAAVGRLSPLDLRSARAAGSHGESHRTRLRARSAQSISEVGLLYKRHLNWRPGSRLPTGRCSWRPGRYHSALKEPMARPQESFGSVFAGSRERLLIFKRFKHASCC